MSKIVENLKIIQLSSLSIAWTRAMLGKFDEQSSSREGANKPTHTKSREPVHASMNLGGPIRANQAIRANASQGSRGFATAFLRIAFSGHWKGQCLAPE